MGNAAAAGPKLSLAELIDRRLAVAIELEALEVLKEELQKQIIPLMQKGNLRVAFGESGLGYQLSESQVAEYDAKAEAYLLRIGKLALFTPAPKVTRAKVLDAHKKALLTDAQLARLQKLAGKLETKYTLRTLKPKGTKADVDTV